ncbi:MAG TPA: hypothetical protein VHQ23_07745, partial [Ilumatobacteraceae bacterium]|nr:hypothetical protein [Ilumatobacteraceae bacterium]
MEQRIEARIAALEAELNSLKALVAPKEDSGPVTSDRRGMMKLMAATAVGAVTGAALLGAQPAAAADGDTVTLGGPNESTSPTQFNSTDTTIVAVSQTGYGIEVDGNIGNAWFPGSGESPLGTAGDVGALWVDGTGDWWAATTTD